MRSNGKSIYVHGTWNAICDICGFEWKASDLRLRWDGKMACPWDWEPRQPLDFVRAKPDHLAPPFTRVDNVDTFVTTQCTLQGNSGIPGYATPNCSIPNLVPSGVFPYNP